jgi:hypothetical protein
LLTTWCAPCAHVKLPSLALTATSSTASNTLPWTTQMERSWNSMCGGPWVSAPQDIDHGTACAAAPG